jgi:deazaflavin-dependent oxidoreductase (nitroreductase family)
MANPFSESKTFHKIGHVTNTTPLRLLPTPRGYAIITTTGRRSGKQRMRAMRAVRDGRQVYGVALLGNRTAWLANIQANPNVTIRLGTKTVAATARRVTDPDERARAANAYRPIAGWYDWFDYANFVWSIPTRTKLLAAHDRWFESGAVVAFDLPADAH